MKIKDFTMTADSFCFPFKMNTKFLLQKQTSVSSKPLRINLGIEDIIGRRSIKALSKYNLVSREHARFNKDDIGNIFVKDLNSSNGVYVNGSKIGTNLRKLRVGDIIGFGDADTDGNNGFVCVLLEECIKREINDEEPEIICIDDTNEEPGSSVNAQAKNVQSLKLILSDSNLHTTIKTEESNASQSIRFVTHSLGVQTEHSNCRDSNSLPESACGVGSSKQIACNSQGVFQNSSSVAERDDHAGESSKGDFQNFSSVSERDNHAGESSKGVFHHSSSVNERDIPAGGASNNFFHNSKSVSHHSNSVPERDIHADASKNVSLKSKGDFHQSSSVLENHNHDGQSSKGVSHLSSSVNKSDIHVGDTSKTIFHVSNTAFHQSSSVPEKNNLVGQTPKKVFHNSKSNCFNSKSFPERDNVVGSCSKNTPVLQNPSEPQLKIELKECSVVLTRFDSEHFRLPPGVKNKRKHENEVFKRTKKKLKVLSDSEESVQSISEDSDTLFQNTRNSKDKNINMKLVDDLNIQDLNNFYPGTKKLSENIQTKTCPESVQLSRYVTVAVPGPSQKSYEHVSVNLSSGVNNSEKLHNCTENHLSNYSEIPICDDVETHFMDSSKGTNSNHDQTVLAADKVSDNEAVSHSYSQIEEIVILSDEDSYFDFSSSQLSHIKGEPPDVQEDMDNFVEGYNEIFEPDSATTIPLGKNENLPSPPLLVLECTTEEDEANEDLEFDALSPVGMQVDETLPIHKDDSHSSNKTTFNDFKTKSVSKSVGRTLLIDPKPMQHRPRKIRGREEEFQEQKKYEREESPVREIVKCRSKPAKLPKKKFITPKKKASSKRSDTVSLKISSNKATLKNFKIPRKPSVECQESSDPTLNSTGVLQKSGLEPAASSSAGDFSAGASESRMKTPSVKVRPEKFSSRSSFLTSEVKIKTPTKKNSVSPLQNSKSSNACGQKLKNPISKSFNVEKAENTQKSQLYTNLNKSHDSIPKGLENVPKKSNFQSSILNKRTPNYLERSCIKKSVSFSIPQPIETVIGGNIHKKTGPLNFRDPRLQKRSNSHDVNQNSPKTFNSTKISPGVSASTVTPSSNVAKTSSSISNFNEPNSLDLAKELINLRTVWLDEQDKMKFPPPQVQEGATDLNLYFNSYHQYVMSFLPMIRLEIWEYMYQESRDVFKSKRQINKFYFSIVSCRSQKDCVELKCESLVAEGISYSPREGTMTIMDFRDSRSNGIFPMFGFIFRHNVSKSVRDQSQLLAYENLPGDWKNNANLWTFSVYVKKKDPPFAFALRSLLKANGICYIRSKLRLVDALRDLKHSSLLKDFLKPQMKTFEVDYQETAATKEYNSSQMKAIKSIASELQNSYTNPKIILLQGPPGTGKTHTIIGLIEKLLFEGSVNMKLLVVAPSNAAVDEIGCRLIDLNERSQWRDQQINFVRVGSVRQVHYKILPYFLDNQAHKSMHDDFSAEYRRKNAEIDKIKQELAELESEKSGYGDQKLIRTKKERLKLMEKQKHSLKERMASKRVDFSEEMASKEAILKDCHIVLSTLNSCGLSILTKTFKRNSHTRFSCCIIDEVTQCTEVEALQPLTYGIDKLIFVGDHKQLPATVVSKIACKHGFERSTFERFHIFFNHYHKQSPVFTLHEQFRMHSEICAFPSKYFYDCKLVTDPDVDIRCSRYPIKPYVLLNIMDSQETNDSSSKFNCVEASVIVNICKCLMAKIDCASNIGIITPYQSQRSLYAKALHQNLRFKNIEVNTVDGFQGREKEIIIVSCVRANSQSGGIGFLANPNRLNVAITRAKKCLIICCHLNSLLTDPVWRVLINDARSRDVLIDVSSQEEIPSVFKNRLIKEKIH